MTTKHRLYTTSFASVYPLYIAKAERKGRTAAFEAKVAAGGITTPMVLHQRCAILHIAASSK